MRPSLRLAALLTTLLLAGLASPMRVRAFCGFYVSEAGSTLVNETTHVVLFREGSQTVLSMQNDYRGPTEDFAMVVPVPVVLSEEDVKTLPNDVFERVMSLSGPRLVEYWEQDPCAQRGYGGGSGSGQGFGRGAGGFRGRSGGGDVRVEAQFAVGEYDVEILSASDSNGLERWLLAHGYRVPTGASEALRPYVEGGMKFFVAKVDAARATFDSEGVAELSPLRIHYASDEFQLPVRLGMLNSSGEQDLIVHIVARERYEVANYPNAFIPTNLDVTNDVRERFGEVYDAMFRATVEGAPGTVVTEYSWQASSCDPCPVEGLRPSEVATLGGDVMNMAGVRPPGPRGGVEIEGPIPFEVFRRITRRHRNEVRFCFQQHPSLRSLVATGVIASGVVNEVSVEGEDPELVSCLESSLRRWSFPDDASPTTFSMPLVAPTLQGGGYVLTRLHQRYAAGSLGDDLVFRPAPGVIGGREHSRSNPEEVVGGHIAAAVNQFQARYAIRHEWEGAMECENPQRGIWGGPPADAESTAPIGAVGRSRAGGDVDFGTVFVGRSASAFRQSIQVQPAETVRPGPSPEPPEEPREAVAESSSGCGCRVGRETEPHALWWLLGFALILRRRLAH